MYPRSGGNGAYARSMVSKHDLGPDEGGKQVFCLIWVLNCSLSGLSSWREGFVSVNISKRHPKKIQRLDSADSLPNAWARRAAIPHPSENPPPPPCTVPRIEPQNLYDADHPDKMPRYLYQRNSVPFPTLRPFQALPSSGAILLWWWWWRRWGKYCYAKLDGM